MMSAYDLRAELANILDTTDTTDVSEIIDKIIASIPAGEFENVLRLVTRTATPTHPV